ncbi:MAG TPA: hypothetical protein VE646_01680 [Actinomycetota bacterium]|nr:hypothetical protein [Actinomycetota bacterium]
MLDRATQGALAGLAAEEGVDEELEVLPGLDIADPDSIGAFQEEHGLEPSGELDAPTQGALAWIYRGGWTWTPWTRTA